MKSNFIERTLASLLSASEYAATAESVAASRGALQRVDPRIKVAGLFALILVVATTRSLRSIGALFCAALILALVLIFLMGRRYLNTRKPMPALLIVVLSVVVAVAQIYVLLFVGVGSEPL